MKQPIDKRILLKGLLIECPNQKSHPDCPGNILRGLPISQFCRVINNLSDEDIDTIMNHHHHCSMATDQKDEEDNDSLPLAESA